ncbi:MAG: PepSY-associated TM helix domain-containing protein [Verrucomicrobiales bacterium]|nr:PepSY-associated TM helix domain-containing protein [Verrucomicrobiales bacterium]
MALKKFTWHKFHRKVHYWGALLCSLPVLIVIITGILLMLKKDFDWIQPETQKGPSKNPTISFQQILDVAKSVPESNIKEWGDIDRLDVRPSKGVIKIRSGVNMVEVQIDQETGEILQTAVRRSDFIETIHDGSIFTDYGKKYVFLPSSVILLILWLTGIYLFLFPINTKRRKRKERRLKKRNPTDPAPM